MHLIDWVYRIDTEPVHVIQESCSEREINCENEFYAHARTLISLTEESCLIGVPKLIQFLCAPSS